MSAGPLTMTDAERVAALHRGNTCLIDALMHMVWQFFIDDGSGDPNAVLHHTHMSAEEGAIEVLLMAGMAEEIAPNQYRLLWDKLERRKML